MRSFPVMKNTDLEKVGRTFWRVAGICLRNCQNQPMGGRGRWSATTRSAVFTFKSFENPISQKIFEFFERKKSKKVKNRSISYLKMKYFNLFTNNLDKMAGGSRMRAANQINEKKILKRGNVPTSLVL